MKIIGAILALITIYGSYKAHVQIIDEMARNHYNRGYSRGLNHHILSHLIRKPLGVMCIENKHMPIRYQMTMLRQRHRDLMELNRTNIMDFLWPYTTTLRRCIMTKVTIDLEGIKPIPQDSTELNREIDNIKEFGVDGIRGIDESWNDYRQRIVAVSSAELRSLRLKALRELTKTPS